MLKKIIKRGIRIIKDMVKNEVAVIEAKKEAFMDIAKDKNSSLMVSDILIGLGIGLTLIGVLIRKDSVNRRCY